MVPYIPKITIISHTSNTPQNEIDTHLGLPLSLSVYMYTDLLLRPRSLQAELRQVKYYHEEDAERALMKLTGHELRAADSSEGPTRALGTGAATVG